MQTKAGLVQLLWRLLVVSVVVYVIAGIILVFMDQADVFGSAPDFASFVNDASIIAFRVGAGSLALMAGLWLSTRPWDEV
jgi:hypothetical protein